MITSAPDLMRYKVVLVPSDDIQPSPENVDIYGEVDFDQPMKDLVASIEANGLAEPILLTQDNYILSGHRRFYATQWLRWEVVPCKYHPTITREGCRDYHAKLAEYNPQRIKSAGSLLREALLRHKTPADTRKAIREHQEAQFQVDAEYMDVHGEKSAKDISEGKQEFLAAVKKVVKELKPYWPVSVRQVHYNLLNDPPLTQRPTSSKYAAEHYRYKNDRSSYTKLVRLLGPARFKRHIPMNAIDDLTRPQIAPYGFQNVGAFVQDQVEDFLKYYRRDRQAEQPRHIEILGEKNTLLPALKRVASEYSVPLSLGRGFCSIPVWRDMAERFERSEKKSMVLIIVSDFDPEGLELADDAIRSLRQYPWKLPVEGQRVAVTREQIDELGLANDFNNAKETSSRFKSFVSRTGDTATWECEALPPGYLIEQVKSAIEANMDMNLFRKVAAQEEVDIEELHQIKQQIAGELKF